MKKLLMIVMTSMCIFSYAGDAAGMNGKGIRLLSEMNNEQKGANAAMSFYSIAQVLAMTELGAKGETATELRDGLSLPPHDFFLKTNKAYTKYRNADILMANKVWLDTHEKILPEYEKGLKRNYASALALADFMGEPDKIKADINSFVSKNTRKQIPKFLSENYYIADTRLFLVNAIYFKSDWKDGFNPKRTYKDIFRNAAGKEEKVDFMHKEATFKYLESSKLDCKAVALPYKQDGIYYIAFQPNDENGMEALLKKLEDTNMGTLVDMSFSEKSLILDMPKLKINLNMSLIPSLKKLGISMPFLPSADFSGMSTNKGLFIGEVLHAVKLDLDEKGTVAVAVTSVKMMRGASMQSKKRFCLDRPFVGMIYDRKSDVILFAMVVNTVAGN